MSATSAFHEFFPQSVSGEPQSATVLHGPLIPQGPAVHEPETAPAAWGARAHEEVSAYGSGTHGEAHGRVQAPLRLTRRGWIVLVVLPLMLLTALLMSLSGFLTSPAKAADTVAELSLTPTVTVTVQQGQSLWAIAGTVAPERDPRDVVADIVQLNNLDGGAVSPGQQLFVPSV
ncbi:LysM peptidoglycan-binding domain-containing protein [Arthrobacter sp. SA17]